VSIAPLTRSSQPRGDAVVALVRRGVVGALAGVVLSVLVAGGALAHAELVDSDPADGATVETPVTTIVLSFSQALDASKSSFRLFGPDGANIGTGRATSPRDMTLGGLALANGDYRIKWVSASADDGDIERGQLTFTVQVAAESPSAAAPSAEPSPSTAPSASTVPSTEPASTAPSASAAPPTPAPSPAPTSPASSTSDVLLPIIIGLLLVAGVGAYVLRRSRGA
jgi:copper resistance protein C